MKQVIINNQLVNTNQYTRLEAIYSIQAIALDEDFSIFNYVGTNLDITMPDFLNRLVDYEEENNIAIHKTNAKVRYGIKLKILLDKQYNTDELMKLATSLMQEYNNLPFYAFTSTVGKANFLCLYICERHFYKDGLMMPVIATSTKYRNKKTGRLCKASDENAICVCQKGDIISYKMTYFSIKETFFKFADEAVFNVFMRNIKALIIKLINKLFNVFVKEGFSFRKFSVDKQTTPFRKYKAKLWNNTFDIASEKINKALLGLDYLFDEYIENEEYLKAKKELVSLFDAWNDINGTGSLTIHSASNEKYGISLNYRNIEVMKHIMDDYVLYIEDSVNDTMATILKKTQFSI